MNITRWIVKALQKMAYAKLVTASKSPLAQQKKILMKILSTNRNTETGKTYNFSSIKGIAEYQANVPIVPAEQYQALIAQEYNGKHHTLTHQPPKFYAMTAGSTGAYKYIPITPDLKRDLDQAVLAFNYLVEKSCPELREGKIQFIVGSASGGTSPEGLPQGFISGFNYKNLPKVIRSRFVIPYEVFEIENADDRYYAMARFLIEEVDLRAICAISPVNIIRVIESALNNMEKLISDLENGTISLLDRADSANIDAMNFSPNPKLADELKAGIKKRTKPSDVVKLLFPNVRYCLCWMGGNMHYYIPELKRYLPSVSIFEMPFSASEGIFALPLQRDKTGGILAIQSGFFEFIKEEDIDLAQPPTLLAHQLEVNGYYYLVITTAGGLYRYSIEDLVRVKAFFNATPVVEFISKKSRQISIANERLNENQVTDAMLSACTECNIPKPSFIFFPCSDKRYRVVVDQLQIDQKQFGEILEKWMQHYSKGYQFEREDQLLLPVELVVSNTEKLSSLYNRQVSHCNLPNAQTKPLHLSNEFDGYKVL